jgi:hypothetical protein
MEMISIHVRMFLIIQSSLFNFFSHLINGILKQALTN